MKSHLLILLVSISFIFSSCSETKRTVQSPDKGARPHLKVLSYNIHHANPPSKPDHIDLKGIAEVIKESGADLVALQEVDVYTRRSGKKSHQAEELGKLTGMHVFFSKGIDYQGGEYGTAILSRFPIIETQRHELPNLPGVKSEPRTLAVATVEVSGVKIRFANTHLDFTNKENNFFQVNEIIHLLNKGKEPVIMAGDFNAVPESPSIKLLDELFTRSCSKKCAFTSPQDKPVRVIDYIMVSSDSNLKKVDHQVIEEVYASDHRPVLAVYRFED